MDLQQQLAASRERLETDRLKARQAQVVAQAKARGYRQPGDIDGNLDRLLGFLDRRDRNLRRAESLMRAKGISWPQSRKQRAFFGIPAVIPGRTLLAVRRLGTDPDLT